MHPKAASAAAMALAWTLLIPAPLMAKPTRTIPRATASRQIVDQPARHSSRERNSRGRAAAHRTTNTAANTHSRTRSNSARHSTTQSASPKHTRSSAQERTLTARAAIATTGRGPRTRRKQRSTLAENRTPRHLADTASDNLDTPPSLRPLKSIEEEASTPQVLPSLRVSSLYDSRGRLVVPKPLYGSREILLHQNQMADRDGLDRVRDDADLLDLRREKKLVALPGNETLRVDDRLPENRRFSRPWTAAFLAVLARDYYVSFHQPLQVNSAVRTVEFQQRLLHSNGNAAPSTGDSASPHLTGQAIDIAKHGLSLTQIAWMRAYLQPFIRQGKIDVEEEFQQACFHISVYKNYLPVTPPQTSIATARQLPE